ncbi:cell wall-associated NlpC family hydrolase [Kribbella amoyensis]|uniref:Cell wall-associated NlpC family hydrolase n=1 Tax=Kribbella amoyensis TaxID=996641 RepID=A0A561BQX0_9ACTN|nr:C40 family peptidase [Kribbella amoyensis]TWD81202.1 cell wall-associated NlpC family hydrolase [Kribbella amoyensis]
MPVTARRTALHGAVSQISESSTRPSGRTLARHRKTSKPATPRAAAAVLTVGLAVSGGAALTVAAPAESAHAAGTSKTTSAAWARGNKPISTKPHLRYADAGSAVRYVQRSLDVPAGGWYGSATRTAVAKFQRSVGLPRTGTMTVNTWRSLFYAANHGLLHGGAGKSSTFQARVLKEAAKLRGTPYRYGGTTPRGFDCSGYTGYVYKKAGKKLPRTSRQQYAATKHLSRKAAKPGDLVFFKSGGGSVYHVGIYAGGNMLWHASKPGRPVAKAKIWSSNVAFGRK